MRTIAVDAMVNQQHLLRNCTERDGLNEIFIFQMGLADILVNIIPGNGYCKQWHLKIYYKNKKVRSLFIRNNPHVTSENHVVYQYTCAKEWCQPNHQSYIGYTTTTVKYH